MSVTAIVPMRGESERVPGKNLRGCAGRPLYHWIITALAGSPLVSEIVIDTDSDTITEDARHAFPDVRVLRRPEHLRGGHVSMNEVLLNAVQQLEAEIFLQSHSTNPLLTTESITRAIDQFVSAWPIHDCLFSVTAVRTRLWDASGHPVNHDPAKLERTQDLAPIYEENSAIYIFPREVLLEARNRIGRRPVMFELDPLEGWDIDEELDFRVAEILLGQPRGRP